MHGKQVSGSKINMQLCQNALQGVTMIEVTADAEPDKTREAVKEDQRWWLVARKQRDKMGEAPLHKKCLVRSRTGAATIPRRSGGLGISCVSWKLR
jgi:hypothetical protein